MLDHYLRIVGIATVTAILTSIPLNLLLYGLPYLYRRYRYRQWEKEWEQYKAKKANRG